jgi:hypothetical protein
VKEPQLFDELLVHVEAPHAKTTSRLSDRSPSVGDRFDRAHQITPDLHLIYT